MRQPERVTASEREYLHNGKQPFVDSSRKVECPMDKIVGNRSVGEEHPARDGNRRQDVRVFEGKNPEECKAQRRPEKRNQDVPARYDKQIGAKLPDARKRVHVITSSKRRTLPQCSAGALNVPALKYRHSSP